MRLQLFNAGQLGYIGEIGAKNPDPDPPVPDLSHDIPGRPEQGNTGHWITSFTGEGHENGDRFIGYWSESMMDEIRIGAFGIQLASSSV
jgi:hypothetical protein